MGHYAVNMRPEFVEAPNLRRVWVVEVFSDGAWRPTTWVGLNRESAREQARDWQAESCVERLRVRAYTPA